MALIPIAAPATAAASEMIPVGTASLRVMTLNIAHGRKDRLNQFLVGKATVHEHLQEIGQLLSRAATDVVALQEADGPSLWSGRFDHVQTLAEVAGYPWFFRGQHTDNWLAQYGTALMSRTPVGDLRSVRFESTPPSPRKGFVTGTVAWPGREDGFEVGLVSVHLDFLSERARERQLHQLEVELSKRSAPVIVLGDFNSEWPDSGSPLQRLADRAGLIAHAPRNRSLATFESARLDWILISEELRFLNYEVLPDVVSDHRAVVAEFGLASDAPAN